MKALNNRVALVTGGSRGIGGAIAVALARAGADVAVNYRERTDAAKTACAEISGMGRKAFAVQADASVAAVNAWSKRSRTFCIPRIVLLCRIAGGALTTSH